MHTAAAEHVLVAEIDLVKHVAARLEQTIHCFKAAVDVVDIVNDRTRDNEVKRSGLEDLIGFLDSVAVNVLQALRVYVDPVVKFDRLVEHARFMR